MSVLNDILERKRTDVAARKAAQPLLSFRDGLQPAVRDFAEALHRPRTGLILEAKAASPSAGPLREDYDPIAIARTYAAFADALSILCDEPFFGGSLSHLDAVAPVAPCPVLCKDFVVDPYQVYEARLHGADAILLMLSVLDDEGWRACAEACEKVGMTPLTEVHDEAELDRALALDAPVIGINNRNLKTLEVDLSVTERLAPKVPVSRVVVAESGIQNHGDLLRLRGQVDAFLIGSSLMSAPSLKQAVRQLVFGRVKICGLNLLEDVWRCWEWGASYGGLIFAPSRRRVTEDDAAKLCKVAPLHWVGVSVNDPPGWVARRARKLGLAAVQLHGDEDEAYLRELRPQLPEGCEIWKAQRISSAAEIKAWPEADRLLLDTYQAGQRGGTGRVFAWEGLESHPERDRIILAGGLSPDNIEQAAALGCWGLDVNSGVEELPGQKDPDRLTELFYHLRGPGREITP